MNSDRWLRFTGWVTEQGIDPLGATAAEVASLLFSSSRPVSPQMVKGTGLACLPQQEDIVNFRLDVVFNPKYLQFKPQGSGVILYFSPEFMLSNKIETFPTYKPWFIPAVPTR